MSGTQSGFFDSLVAAVRENPLSAALIGGGAVWLLVGNERMKSAANSATAAASPIGDIGARNLQAATSGLKMTAAPPTAPETHHEGTFRRGAPLRDANGTASEAMSDTAGKVKVRFGESVAYARDNLGKLGDQLPGREDFAKAQSSLSGVIEQQPI